MALVFDFRGLMHVYLAKATTSHPVRSGITSLFFCMNSQIASTPARALRPTTLFVQTSLPSRQGLCRRSIYRQMLSGSARHAQFKLRSLHDRSIMSSLRVRSSPTEPGEAQPPVVALHTNRLASEQSPYLRQHMHNPVCLQAGKGFSLGALACAKNWAELSR